MAHHSFRNHRKLRRLRDLLGVSKAEAYGVISLVWDEAYETENVGPDGRLAGWTPADIAAAADWKGDPGKLVDALTGAGLLEDRGGCYAIHDYARWAPDYVKKRWRRLGLENAETAFPTPGLLVCPVTDRTTVTAVRTTVTADQPRAREGRLPNPTQPKATPSLAEPAAPVGRGEKTDGRQPKQAGRPVPAAPATPAARAGQAGPSDTPPTPEPKARPRRPLWDAIVARFYGDADPAALTESHRKEIGRLEREFSKCCLGDHAEAARLFPAVVTAYETTHPTWECTANAVLGHWHALRPTVRKRQPAPRVADDHAQALARLRAAEAADLAAAIATVEREYAAALANERKAHGLPDAPMMALAERSRTVALCLGDAL